MKKKAAKIIIFILAFATCFLGSCYVLDFKYLDSVFKVDMFYEQEDNTVDVLVLGSSHSYQGVNTAVLWEEYGYAAFDLCGSAQPIWNTYYYLEEALKTQTPKVIIMDVYTIHYTMEYSETSSAIKNTYGLKLSQTKIDAINASFDTESVGNQYLFSILQYHSRYSDLSETDFYPYQANKDMYENYKGFYCYFRSTEIADVDLTDVTNTKELSEKTEEYYRKIIELAQLKDIPIVMVAIPFETSAYYQGFFNTAQAIAEEYSVPFYNFMSEYKDELGLDYSTDFSDSQHLNYLGNTKLTRFLGDMLTENYSIPDRRGDSKYDSWSEDAEVYYNQLENHTVTLLTSLDEYLQAFSEDRYKIVVTSSEIGEDTNISSSAKESITSFFSSLGVSESEYAAGGMWVFENSTLTYSNGCDDEDFQKTVRLSGNDSVLVKVTEKEDDEGNTYTVNSIYYEKEEYTKTNSGVNIFVYDTFTKSCIDMVGVNYSNGSFSHRTSE